MNVCSENGKFRMQPRDLFLLAMDRQELPKVPFVETSIAFGLGEKILGRKLKPVEIPRLNTRIRNVEDEKELDVPVMPAQ